MCISPHALCIQDQHRPKFDSVEIVSCREVRAFPADVYASFVLVSFDATARKYFMSMMSSIPNRAYLLQEWSKVQPKHLGETNAKTELLERIRSRMFGCINPN